MNRIDSLEMSIASLLDFDDNDVDAEASSWSEQAVVNDEDNQPGHEDCEAHAEISPDADASSNGNA